MVILIDIFGLFYNICHWLNATHFHFLNLPPSTSIAQFVNALEIKLNYLLGKIRKVFYVILFLLTLIKETPCIIDFFYP